MMRTNERVSCAALKNSCRQNQKQKHFSEFGHYRWEAFQHALIETIGRWERAPESERGDWEYYDHWVAALQKLIDERQLLTTPASVPNRHH